MCYTIEWYSSVCGHVYIFKPEGLCMSPAPNGACRHTAKSMELRSDCRECLAAYVQTLRQQLTTALARCRAYEYRRVVSHEGHDNETEDEQAYNIASLTACLLARHLIQATSRFNAARRRYFAIINRYVDAYEARPHYGTAHRPVAGQEGMPAPAPQAMYRDVLHYLRRAPNRLENEWMIEPPEIAPW
ncbi:MAG: hypothetical protein M1826_007180 [Phylliscum demangeonii]|nr:MAG: hypothetical protein M1826_007180 [Phylliscum demangeonii]